MRRVLAIRFSPEELQALRISAARARVPVATHIRELALAQARIDEAEEQLEVARREAFNLAEEQRRREGERHRAEAERPEREPGSVPWWAQEEGAPTFADWKARREGRL